MHADWAALKGNLQEIYDVVLQPACSDHSLVANLSGTRLYATTKFQGRIWNWFYGVFNLVLGHSFQSNRFLCAMQHTHKLFSEHLDYVAKCANEYCEFVHASLNDKPASNKDGASRKAIGAWHESTSPLIKLLKNAKKPGLIDLIHIGFIGDARTKSKSAPFSCGDFTENLTRLRLIVDLEGYLQESLPWLLLSKAASSQALHPDEEKRFKAFAVKFDKHAFKIGIRKMHKTLEGIIAVIKSSPKNTLEFPLSVINLELALVDQGVSLFSKNDAKQLAWRENLALGDHLDSKDYEIVVGPRIGLKPEGQEDKNHIFEIQNVPNAVLSVGINTAIHQLKKKISMEHGWGIKSAKYIEIDPKGKFAIIERLKEPIDSYQWKSAKTLLNPEDEDVATPLWRLLQWLLEQQKTPHHFTPEHLMFNGKGRLKCLKVALEGEFNFDALVGFAYKCSKGHPKIFQFLMEGSGISEHIFAKFYEKIVEGVSKGKTNDLKILSAAMGIGDKNIMATGDKLRVEALALKQQCVDKLKGKYTLEKLEKEVGAALDFCYKESASAGIIPEYLEEEIIKETQIALD